MDNLKGIYKTDTSTLEVYNNDKLLFETEVGYDLDFWHGANINGKEVDFNLTNDVNGYSLSFYPEVHVCSEGFYNTNCYINEPVTLIVI